MASENDKSFFQIETAISKALVPLEKPIKVKHIRSAIISTFTHQGAKVFWSLAIRQPVLDNSIVAWKFSQLLHKVLNEGHSLCINDSMINCEWLIRMGKLWGFVEDGYGVCIESYCTFLNTKINFHFGNPRFNANLQMTHDEYEPIVKGDKNYLFQVTLEIFDYLDDAAALAGTILESLSKNVTLLDTSQCKLAPMATIVEDTYLLYGFAFPFMDTLHKEIPFDLLTGHRERYLGIYRQLSLIYQQCRASHIPLPDSIPASGIIYSDFSANKNEHQKDLQETQPSPPAPSDAQPTPPAPSDADYPPLIEF